MENGFILLSRDLLEHQIFAHEKLLKIWVWCLMKANYKDKAISLKVGKGQTIVNVKRGSFIFGRHKAEEELSIDGSTIYKLMQKLEIFGSIEINSNNQYSIVSICNYDTYQQVEQKKEQPSNNEVTTKEQPSNNERTQLIKTINKKKKNNNSDNIESTMLIEQNVIDYFISNGYSKEAAIKFFKYYSESDWKDSKGNKVKNWKQKALMVWFKDENKITQNDVKHTNYCPEFQQILNKLPGGKFVTNLSGDEMYAAPDNRYYYVKTGKKQPI